MSSSESDQERGPLRVYKPRINFADIERKFKERFRVSGEILNFFEDNLRDRLHYDSQRNYALTPREQILLCFRFLAANEDVV